MIIPQGQKLQDLAPEGSYLADSIDVEEDFFDKIGTDVTYVLPSLNYWDVEIQTKVANLLTTAQEAECGTEGTAQSWLQSFVGYATAGSVMINTETQFLTQLRLWLDDANGGSRYSSDILWNDASTRESIVATKVTFNQ